MRVCLYGAGALGGFLGAHLSRSGCDVSAVEVGPTLEALRKHGLRVQTKTELLQQPVRATDQATILGVQDLIVVAVKAPHLVHVAKNIAPLIGPETIIMPAMNGVPWWFFEGFGGQYAGMRLESVDPNGAIAEAIPSRQVVGCVVHGSFSSIEPGFTRHGSGKRLIIGAPDGSDSERVRTLATLLSKAGMDVEVSRCIQMDVWYKLWGNMTMNPVSAFTGATLDRILDDPLVTRFCLAVMGEAARIGARFGCVITQTGEERNAVTRELGAFKTSMLQDVEAGKPVELDALVSVVREIGQKVGEPTPYTDILLGLTRLHAQAHGLYPLPVRSAGAGA
ncbi:MAG: 2-dehydropantoate 2-reductase [Candidatus Korobacteraceae bacterium]|jgi:2-dehydropantoate 2-reductase